MSLDFVLIERVLVNVVDNALKYSPADSPIEITAHPAGAFMEVEVADRGTGIPPEDLTRIFDKFYRVQRPDNVSGTGLGLSISKGIVQAQGGFIRGRESHRRGYNYHHLASFEVGACYGYSHRSPKSGDFGLALKCDHAV